MYIYFFFLNSYLFDFDLFISYMLARGRFVNKEDVERLLQKFNAPTTKRQCLLRQMSFHLHVRYDNSPLFKKRTTLPWETVRDNLCEYLASLDAGVLARAAVRTLLCPPLLACLLLPSSMTSHLTRSSRWRRMSSSPASVQG